MTYGLKWINSEDSQSISTEKYGLVFVGNATYDNTIRPDYYSQVSSGSYGSSTGRGNCYNYTIQSPSPPIVFIRGPNGGNGQPDGAVALCSIANTSGNSWNIVVARVGGAVVGIPTVKCFAKLSGPGAIGGWGIRTYDANLNRTWDSNENMLVIDSRIDWPAASDSSSSSLVQQVGILTIPNPHFMVTTEAVISGTAYTYTPKLDTSNTREYTTGWIYNGGNIMTRDSKGIQLGTTYSDGTGDGSNSNILPASRMYIINGNKYS